MPSISGKTKVRRRARANKMGRERKRMNRRGTTPAFPVHLEEAPGAEAKAKAQPADA